jgi:metallo-beta-lactamase family protein
MVMKITFLGATGTVTGSKYLVEDGQKRVLIDCGLFQGRKDLRLRNWEDLPIDPKSIDAIVLTHAHLDHSGYIPLIVNQGFRGSVYCSDGTRDLCAILLPDSGHIQEEDAASANRNNYSKHKPALPLYTEEDARECLSQFKPVPFGQTQRISDNLSFTLHRAGHIIGASMVKLTGDGGTSILFSGDLGRMNDPIMKPPAEIQDSDYILVESTYGDRLHDKADPAKTLCDAVRDTVEHGGTVLIPAFAVGRAQLIMYYLHMLQDSGQLPRSLPIYLDSPMAISASELMLKYMNDHRLPAPLVKAVCNTARYIRTIDESKALDENANVPKIIISASGMATGGRILHHLKHYMGERRNTIILAGYQAEGTRGDRMAKGEAEIKIHGYMRPLRARVVKLDNMSAHADYNEILGWLKHFTHPPKKIFIVHGEHGAAESLKKKISTELGWNGYVPQYMHKEEV